MWNVSEMKYIFKGLFELVIWAVPIHLSCYDLLILPGAF